jgi:hypothetical protein
MNIPAIWMICPLHPLFQVSSTRKHILAAVFAMQLLLQ